jgi:KaiC/GvpD/RAD55 family RecA-like ATPase
MILFEFIKGGLTQKEQCLYVSEEDNEAVKREMSDGGIKADEFIKNDLLSIHQILNLSSPQIYQITLERLSQITLDPWTKKDQQERVILSCIFKTDTEEQIRLNLKWKLWKMDE